ncbi:hypothetical protein BKA61DRAFT_543704 [Leptodontidium sp. MPI-SDFR-AT-0119]|nr:hypothetical protein BKA61DRAFT_543704 [Leptodontidium sp. MPI-SDFR-AT-0119]
MFFDDVAGLSPKDAAEKYAFRKHVSTKWTCFDLNQHGGLITKNIREIQGRNQLDLLNVFRGLLLESKASTVQNPYYGYIDVEGKNLEFIRKLLSGSEVDIIDSVFNTSFDKDTNDSSSLNKVVTANDKNTLVYVIQLILTPFSLDPGLCNSKPVFTGLYKQVVNIRWLLHVVNFFKFHLKSDGEGLLEHEYRILEHDEFPQFWTGHIKGGTQPLARHWKGLTKHQDMDFFFDTADKPPSYVWPENFEAILGSNPFEDPAQQRRAKRAKVSMDSTPGVKQFWGSCRGSQRGHVYGRVHALTTQQGFHGFQRLTMMKYYTKQDANGHDIYDPFQAWCYEGCVLPGGRLIVGRWWSALGDPNSSTTNSGPFLWWNTHRSGEEEIKEHEALDFMSMFEHSISFAV